MTLMDKPTPIKPTCREYVYSGMGYGHLCGNPAKHDDGTRCGVHCAEAKAKREAKANARYQEQVARAKQRDREQQVRRVAKMTDVIMAKTPVPMTLEQAAALALAIDEEVRK